jgi:serine/threonine protein kinase
MSSTHYEVLEVLPSASPSVITAAYKALMKDNHPDARPGHEAWAARINEAFRILSDPVRRTDYDTSLAYRPGGVIGDKYRIIEQIAVGGFGTTYKAEHLALPGSLVCVKHAGRITPEYEAILQKEAQIMWDLRHYAIPAIRDYVRLGDSSVALVMSFIEGINLHDLVEQHGPIEPEDVAWIVERVLNALRYMHDHGVVHGDLKPKNIMIQEESHMVSVVDFGLAKMRPTATDGSAGYTPCFSPPEARKGMTLIPESDMYSLGATMLFALSGDLRAVEARQVPATVPDPICEFIRRMMHRNPLDRPCWQHENLLETIVNIRETTFGRRRSGMKPIRHIPHPTATRR